MRGKDGHRARPARATSPCRDCSNRLLGRHGIGKCIGRPIPPCRSERGGETPSIWRVSEQSRSVKDLNARWCRRARWSLQYSMHPNVLDIVPVGPTAENILTADLPKLEPRRDAHLPQPFSARPQHVPGSRLISPELILAQPQVLVLIHDKSVEERPIRRIRPFTKKLTKSTAAVLALRGLQEKSFVPRNRRSIHGPGRAR